MKDIYVLENTRNGKLYIGSSRDASARKNQHYSLLNRGVHPNTYLQASWDKYGKDSFVFEIVSSHPSVSLNELRLIELDLIKRVGTHIRDVGYNLSLSSGGTGVQKHTEDSKAKISRALTEIWANPSESLKTVCRDAILRRWQNAPDSHYDQATNQAKKMGDANKGKIRSTEFKENRAKYVKSLNQTQDQFKKKRIVDDLGTVYNSIGKAASAFNVSPPTISRYIRENMSLNGRSLKYESY